jgi:hypothetical protein
LYFLDWLFPLLVYNDILYLFWLILASILLCQMSIAVSACFWFYLIGILLSILLLSVIMCLCWWNVFLTDNLLDFVSNQTASLLWRVKTIYIQDYYWKVCGNYCYFVSFSLVDLSILYSFLFPLFNF